MTTKVTTLGTGGALPPTRRAQTGILFEKGADKLLVDCGSGILLRLSEADIDISSIKSILITHLHLDHVSDLLPIITARWLAGHPETEVIGPAGIKKFLTDEIDAHEYLKMHVSVSMREVEPGEHFQIAGFDVVAMETEHWIYTLAYKFDNQITYSADTNPIPEMRAFSDGCQLLIHECSFPDGHEAPYHTTPTELGELLKDSNVPRLVLTHFYPECEGRESEVVEAIKKNYPGQIYFSQDLSTFDV